MTTISGTFVIHVELDQGLDFDLSQPPPNAPIGQPYSWQIPIIGGVPPYQVIRLSPPPHWMTISGTGFVTGTPTANDVGANSIHVQVTDSAP